MSSSPNWVERRFALEHALTEKAPEVWNAVRAALQDACVSYNTHYATPVHEVTCHLETDNRLLITRPPVGLHVPPTRRTQIVVEYHDDRHEITYTTGSSITVHINGEEPDVVFAYVDGSRIEPDALSERILKPFLFPSPRRPR